MNGATPSRTVHVIWLAILVGATVIAVASGLVFETPAFVPTQLPMPVPR